MAPHERYEDTIHVLQNPKLPRNTMGFNNRNLSHKTLKDGALNKKTSQKKPKGDHSSQKRGGGVRQGMIMITDSMVFFKPSPIWLLTN